MKWLKKLLAKNTYPQIKMMGDSYIVVTSPSGDDYRCCARDIVTKDPSYLVWCTSSPTHILLYCTVPTQEEAQKILEAWNVYQHSITVLELKEPK